MFEKYALRRPFSRKIRLPTAAAHDPDGQAGFQAKHGRIIGQDALASMIAAIGNAYAANHEQVRRLVATLSSPRFAGTVEALFRRADLRKYTMAVLRDYCRAGGELSRPQAELLAEITRALDPDAHHVFTPAAEPIPHPRPLAFDYVSKPPVKLRIAITRAFPNLTESN